MKKHVLIISPDIQGCGRIKEHLENEDGIKLLSTLRELKPMPIFVLSDNGDTAHKVEVFTRGADDFLLSPYDIEECVIRAYSLLRRYTDLNSKHEPNYTIIKKQDLMINQEHQKVYLHGVEIEMTRKEFDVLLLLASHPERVCTYEQIYHAEDDKTAAQSVTAHRYQ